MDLNIKKENNNNYENNIKRDKFRTEKTTSFIVYKNEIIQNKKEKPKLCKRYRIRSKRIKIKNQKSAYELEKNALKIYKIYILQQ